MRALALRCALCVACARAGWIDADTPKNAQTITGYGDDSKHTLVMSDEFETPHRSFKDGEDPRWTTINKNDYTNKALQYYSDCLLYTSPSPRDGLLSRMPSSA